MSGDLLPPMKFFVLSDQIALLALMRRLLGRLAFSGFTPGNAGDADDPRAAFVDAVLRPAARGRPAGEALDRVFVDEGLERELP
jgi:hypothetical protein